MENSQGNQGEPVRWLVDNGEDALCFGNVSQAEHYANTWGLIVSPLYTSVQTIPAGLIKRTLTHEMQKAAEDVWYQGCFSASDLTDVLEAAIAAAPEYKGADQ